MAVVPTNLGVVTAYGDAVAAGYTGTKAEWQALMASYATVAEQAQESADAAAQSATDADNAKSDAITAKNNAETAKNDAITAKNDAVTAKNAAQTAKTDAEKAKDDAQDIVDGINAKSEKIDQNTAEIEDLKSGFSEVEDTLNSKANIDGFYEDLTAGDAEQLVSSQYVEDKTPYLYRTSGGSTDIGNREYVDAVVGGTVNWNQQIFGTDSATNWVAWKMSVASSDGAIVATAQEDNVNAMSVRPNAVNVVQGHKYLLDAYLMASEATTRTVFTINENGFTNWTPLVANTWTRVQTVNSAYATSTVFRVFPDQAGGHTAGFTLKIKNYMLIDLTTMFGSTIADYIYSLEQSTAVAGVAWFRKLFPKDYYEYNAGELKSVEGVSAHETVGFNQFDGVLESGFLDASGADAVNTSAIRSKNYVPVFGGQSYCFTLENNTYVRFRYYDADKAFIGLFEVNAQTANGYVFTPPSNAHYMRFWVLKESANSNFCINLSWSGTRNGEYEPYTKHSYALDNSLTLRGIPKLDAQNNLYYDGDRHLPEGKVERRYGVVDLGTLNWTYMTGLKRFQATISDLVSNVSVRTVSMICSKYVAITDGRTIANVGDKCVYGAGDNKYIYVHDSAYTDTASFKAAMSGVMLVYELEAPVIEEADPYQHVQIVDDLGTEEYVSTGIVPVGHKTRYPANLRDKLQHLPDLADADGYYMINQTGAQMSLERFRIPKAPTSPDGTYTLKATVSGGTPTYTWESEVTS